MKVFTGADRVEIHFESVAELRWFVEMMVEEVDLCLKQGRRPKIVLHSGETGTPMN